MCEYLIPPITCSLMQKLQQLWDIIQFVPTIITEHIYEMLKIYILSFASCIQSPFGSKFWGVVCLNVFLNKSIKWMLLHFRKPCQSKEESEEQDLFILQEFMEGHKASFTLLWDQSGAICASTRRHRARRCRFIVSCRARLSQTNWWWVCC